jgi:hypothetical protein
MIARTIRWLCVCTILLAGCNTPRCPPAPPSLHHRRPLDIARSLIIAALSQGRHGNGNGTVRKIHHARDQYGRPNGA